jgi:hypothetical protein
VTAVEWCDGLRAAIAAYTHTRRRTPAAQVTLTSDERLYLFLAEPAGAFVAMSAYPEEREAEMIRHPDDEEHAYTPRVLLIDPAKVAKVELLYDVPTRQAVGFGIEL